MGYQLIDVERVDAAGGHIYKLVSSDSAFFTGFGEFYVSVIEKGVFRGWKVHTKMQSLLFVAKGHIEFHVVAEDGRCETISLSGESDNLKVLRIEPGTQYGFRATSEGQAWVLNVADMKHTEGEVQRPPLNSHDCLWLS